MKRIYKILLGVILFTNIVHTYPQAMLININNDIVENPILVDMIIREKTKFINIDVKCCIFQC